MPPALFVIIRPNGRILTMHEGEPILFETEAAARAWLSEGDTVAPAPEGLAGVRPIDGGPARD